MEKEDSAEKEGDVIVEEADKVGEVLAEKEGEVLAGPSTVNVCESTQGEAGPSTATVGESTQGTQTVGEASGGSKPKKKKGKTKQTNKKEQ